MNPRTLLFIVLSFGSMTIGCIAPFVEHESKFVQAMAIWFPLFFLLIATCYLGTYAWEEFKHPYITLMGMGIICFGLCVLNAWWNERPTANAFGFAGCILTLATPIIDFALVPPFRHRKKRLLLRRRQEKREERFRLKAEGWQKTDLFGALLSGDSAELEQSFVSTETPDPPE